MLAVSITSNRTSPDSRPTTPAIGGRSVSKVLWPLRRLPRRRGGALGDPVEDHQELRGAAVGPLQGRPREGVEDPSATAALEVHHGGAMTAVNPQALTLPAARAGEAVGVEQFDELAVAGVLV